MIFQGGSGRRTPLSPILIRPCNIYLLYLLSGVDYLINSLEPNEVCIFFIRNAIKNGLWFWRQKFVGVLVAKLACLSK